MFTVRSNWLPLRIPALLVLTFACTVGMLGVQDVAAAVRIVCVGDSITEGSGLANPSVESYPAKLQRLLGSEFEVRNYGVSGRTLLRRGDFPYWNEAAYRQSRESNPQLVIIKLGANDSKPQNWRYSTNFVSDFEAFIASYTNLTSRPRVLLCTPCPVYGSGAFNIRPGVVATNIALLIRGLSARLGLELIDLHVSMAGHREWFPDTVHPNSRGTTVLAALVRTAIVGGHPNPPTPPVGSPNPPPRNSACPRNKARASLALDWSTPPDATQHLCRVPKLLHDSATRGLSRSRHSFWPRNLSFPPTSAARNPSPNSSPQLVIAWPKSQVQSPFPI